MRVEYSVGWPVDAHTGRAIAQLPAGDWTPMLAADGLPGTPAVLDSESGPDTVGEVAEITALLPHLQTWPEDHRVFVRRVKPLRDTTPKPLTGLDQLELDLQLATAGWRYEAFATNHATPRPRPRPPSRSPPGWTGDTGSMQESKIISDGATTPAPSACPRRSSPSTPPGTASKASLPTSSPGSSCSAAPATSPGPNPAPCSSRSSIPRPPSPEAGDDAG